jgi:type II restriction enzyme
MSSADNWTQWTDDFLELLKLKGLGPGTAFTLDDAYTCEVALGRMHPKNHHIRDKIRQQLQIMRDHDIIEFVNDDGVYKFT